MFTQQFVSYAQEFKRRNQNVLSLTFKHRRRISTCVIEFENYNLELRYIKKQGLYFKANTLYSVLYLRKNSGQYYHLTDIMPLLERKNFKTCYFGILKMRKGLNIALTLYSRSLILWLRNYSPS